MRVPCRMVDAGHRAVRRKRIISNAERRRLDRPEEEAKASERGRMCAARQGTASWRAAGIQGHGNKETPTSQTAITEPPHEPAVRTKHLTHSWSLHTKHAGNTDSDNGHLKDIVQHPA